MKHMNGMTDRMFRILYEDDSATNTAVFKTPQHKQLRVGRRPWKRPGVDTKILKKI